PPRRHRPGRLRDRPGEDHPGRGRLPGCGSTGARGTRVLDRPGRDAPPIRGGWPGRELRGRAGRRGADGAAGGAGQRRGRGGGARARPEGDVRYGAPEPGQGREARMAKWEEHVTAGGVASMRRCDQMAERIRDGFPVGRRPPHDYQLSWREQPHTYSHRLAEDAYQRLASTDPTADAALNRDPETCPADLSDSIARLVERRAARGQSIGEMFTFAYRLPRPKGHAALRRAREVADRILAHYGDHLDAHAAA